MVKYSQKEKIQFNEFRPRVAVADPLTKIVASLPEYPYTEVKSYKELTAAHFNNMFTTDGLKGVIKIPTTNKIGDTKYVISRRVYPVDGYKLLCVVSLEGDITCKIEGILHNPQVNNLLFSLMVKEVELLPEIGNLMPYQVKRDYEYKHLFEILQDRVNNKSINLKEFMEIRHDIVQIAMCNLFGLTLHKGTDLNLSDFGLFGKQTPDFLEVVGDEALVGDVTVVNDVTNAEIIKFTKYEGLMNQLIDQGKRVIPFYLVFDHSFSKYYDVIRNCSLSQVEEYSDFENLRGILEQMYLDLLGTYPEDSTPLIGNVYPVVDIDTSSTSFWSLDGIRHLNDEEIITKYFTQEVMESYKDNVFKVENIYNAEIHLKELNKEFRESNKPSHYIPIPPDDAGFKQILGKSSEQEMLINFFSNSVPDEVYKVFSEELVQALNSSDLSFNMFKTGQYVENEKDLRLEFHNWRENQSFEEFLRYKGFDMPPKNSSKIPYQKVLQLSSSAMKKIPEFLESSGQDYRKTHPMRDYKEKTTCDLEYSYSRCERFLDLLACDNSKDFSEDFFSELGKDSTFFESIKQDYSEFAKADISKLGTTYCYKYLRYSSLLYEQLIHFSNLSMTKKRFCLFNSGIPNICCVMRCGYRGMAQQVGKPFMFMGFTTSQEFLETNMFGKLIVKHLPNGKIFFRTRWFRLPTFRLEFFRDQYYSILSSTMASLARIRNIGFDKESIRGVFCVRTLIGLMANQKAMEKLADARYAIMSSFATHTNFEELLIEKFAPPYKSYIEAWIVMKLFKKLPQFRKDVYESNNIKINVPVLDYLDRRFQQSTGGRFNITAIWSERKIHSLQDLLDELFLYVHTPKEPSTAFHEEVNAIKTIQKYQELFDKYSFDQKCGKHEDPVQWLKEKPVIGFDRDFLFAAALHYRNTTNIDFNKIERLIANENLGELTSTKSVIPDVTRKIKPMDKFFKYRVEDHVKKFGSINEDQKKYIEEHKNRMKETKGRSTAEIYHGRTKVHDEILTYLSHYNEETVLNNALHYMMDPSCEVLTDICIKAQYGAKREFYVMNMGAKVMARVVENFYKEIAKKSATEMISVPGDRKLITMQSMMDRTIKHAMKNENIVSYCNGDCTKWSAAETMEAFHVLTEGICANWNSDFKRVLHSIIHLWTKKNIQIPLNIVSKVLPLGHKTDYIIHAAKNNFKIPSSQNFLQGVFNYMSSVKADVCNKYTCHLWNKFKNDDKRFYVEYLVHSDDYVFAFSAPDLSVIEEFRAFHKICMRLCGITDSSKKTNVQPIFMEFISLVCFNGSMSYPTIKKTKEVATTLPCESFTNDSDMVCSRTGECVRVGVDHYSAWVFHRIHMQLLRRAYSMHLGGFNYIEDSCNKPVQVFGQSDMHPIFYFLCKGDPNNLRIFNYSENRIYLYKLYTLENFSDSLKTVHSSFREPTFIYNNYTKRIAKLRKSLDITVDQAMSFWETNMAYNFVKPRAKEDLKMWLKCMYFKSSFVKAYNRDTRTTRLLRLSMFSRGKCVTYKTDDELNEFYFKLSSAKTKKDRQVLIDETMLTIKELIEYVECQDYSCVDDKELMIAILMGDSTSDLIYNWSETAFVQITNKVNSFNTCATFSPYKATWLNVSQPVDQVICYGIDMKVFLENFGLSANVSAVRSDFNKLCNSLPGLFDIVNDKKLDYGIRMKTLQVAYNMYVNNLPKYQVCMSSKRHRQNTVDFLTDAFKYCSNPVFVSEVISKSIHYEMNPYTLERFNIMGTQRSISTTKLLTHNICLTYVYLISCLKLTVHDTIDILSNTIIDDLGIKSTVLNYFKLISFEDAKDEGLDYVDLLGFAFLKKLLLNDNIPLFELNKSKQFYNYLYVKSQTYNSVTREYEGDVEVIYNFENVSCLAKMKDNKLIIECDSRRLSHLELAALIGMKLTSKLTQSNFLRQITRPRILEIAEEIVAWNDGFYLTYNDNKVKFEFVKKGSKYFGLPVVYNAKLMVNSVFSKTDSLILSSNFYIYKYSVMLGSRKLYNLPFKNMHFSHINLKTDFNDIAMYNDLLPFFVLGTGIKSEHDTLSLVKIWCEKNKDKDFGVEPLVEKREIRTADDLLAGFDLSDIEIVFDDFMSDFETPDEDIDLMDDRIPDEEYILSEVDEFEVNELEQDPWSKFTKTIELVDKSLSTKPINHSVYELELVEDHLQNAIIELCGMRELYFMPPSQYLFTVKTILGIRKKAEFEWLIPYTKLLEMWVKTKVKIVPDLDKFQRFYLRVVEHKVKFYIKRNRTVKFLKEHNLRDQKDCYCVVDFEILPDDTMVEYYKEVSEETFWEECEYFDPLPFYPRKNDAFYKLLKTVQEETMTL